ncbi:uncharacterized protein G2W53_014039 [Senna tora]|uniref:Uncharacterized protein n=1 Tax=Senna tora TaxID=362788 RepID=A0A834U2C8_9FABA|nr:uncharacterized protein G2W53_014039 [Senna tora]
MVLDSVGGSDFGLLKLPRVAQAFRSWK